MNAIVFAWKGTVIVLKLQTLVAVKRTKTNSADPDQTALIRVFHVCYSHKSYHKRCLSLSLFYGIWEYECHNFLHELFPCFQFHTSLHTFLSILTGWSRDPGKRWPWVCSHICSVWLRSRNPSGSGRDLPHTKEFKIESKVTADSLCAGDGWCCI